MKNIQVIDGAVNATFSIFQAEDADFREIFPGSGQDLEIVEDYVSRVGEDVASATLGRLWMRPLYKGSAHGIHGTLFYDYKDKAHYLPESRREVDRAREQINEWQRALYSQMRQAMTPED